LVNDFNVRNRGCAILMNCKTGAIYGMAQYPSFDLNEPRKIADPVKADAINAAKTEVHAEKQRNR